MKTIREISKSCFPRLYKAARNLRDDLKVQKPTTMTPMGFNFTGNSAMVSNTFEPGETKVFLDVLSKVDTVINIGANIGYYSCIALQHDKEVIAFEPIPTNVKGLLRNIKANGWEKNIEVYPMALGDSIGVIEIFGGGTGASLIQGWAGAHDLDTTLVPCSTLDTVLANRFSKKNCLMMVDIEGAEKMMLEGAQNFLNTKTKHIWFMEVSVRAHQPDGVTINPNLSTTFEQFWSRGYEAWTTHKVNRKVTKEEIDTIVNGGKDTLFADTFLFIHPETHGEYKPIV